MLTSCMCLQRPEEGVRSPAPSLTGGCEPSSVDTERQQPSSMILGLALLWLRVYHRSPVLGELPGSAEEAGECGREVPAEWTEGGKRSSCLTHEVIKNSSSSE